MNDATYVMGINHRIAEKIALRFANHKRVLDACAGSGFVALAFAKTATKVVAVDVNPVHLDMARENSKIAGLSNIEFVLGDVSDDRVLQSIGTIDGANLDMDWAVGEDKHVHVTKLSQMIPPADVLFEKISRLTKNISIRLPKEIHLHEMDNLPECELEEIYLDGDFKFYMAYFGDLIHKVGTSKLQI